MIELLFEKWKSREHSSFFDRRTCDVATADRRTSDVATAEKTPMLISHFYIFDHRFSCANLSGHTT